MRNKIKSLFRIIKLFQKAFGAYKLHIVVLTAVGFLSGILEGIGVNALIPLFSFIIGEGGPTDFISKTIERAFMFIGIDFTIKYLLIFIAVLFILKAIVLFVGAYIQFKITHGYAKNIQIDIFRKALRSCWPYLIKEKIGHLEKVLSFEVRIIATILATIGSFVLIITGLFIYLLVAINISFSITVITLGLGIIVIILFHPLVKKTREISKELAVKNRQKAHFVNENILGMKTLKIMAVTDAVVLVADSLFEKLRKLHVKRSLISNIFGSFFQPFGVIFILLLFSFSYKTGALGLPAFIAIVYLIQRIFTHIQGVQSHIQTIFGQLPYLEHVLDYQEQMLKNEEENTGKRTFSFKKVLSFKDVSFGYGKGKNVLSNVSFHIPRGSFVGLIGPSGSGKTTIVDLILLLFRPNHGVILLDGIPISEIELDEYRRNVGYVSQDIHLINDTIANNIRFFDDTITDKQIVQAAKQANIYDVIEALPQRFSSKVGERGVHFSVGQRQRIVIARVLVRNPQFLILDEATSALDNESEKRIQEVIENLKGKMTVLVIAHRLGTVLNCDNLLVLDGGRICEEGKPSELLKKKDSYFFKMYNIRE